MPSSNARSMILKLSSSVVCQPKFIVPKQRLLTRTPCFPKRLYSTAISDAFLA